MNTLRSAMSLARSEYNERVPVSVEQAIRAKWRAKQVKRRLVRRWTTGVIASAAVLAGLMLIRPQKQSPKPPGEVRIPAPRPVPAIAAAPAVALAHTRVASKRSVRRSAGAVRDPSEFIAIPYAGPLLPTDQIDIYRVKMPRAALASFGMPVQPGWLDATVTADLAVGSDGVARAVRFVR